MYRTGGASVRACLEEDDMINSMINSEFNAKSECNLRKWTEPKENIEYFRYRALHALHIRSSESPILS